MRTDKLDAARAHIIARRQKLEARKQTRIDRVFEITRNRLLREQAAGHAVKPWGMDAGGSGYNTERHQCSVECDHDVPEKSFANDVARKLRMRSVMPGGDKQDMRGKSRKAEALGKLLRRVEALLKREKSPRMVTVLKGVRSAASLLQQEAVGGASALSPVQRKQALKLLDAFDRRGQGLGNNTSKLPHGTAAETDGAGYKFAGRDVGMQRGDGLYAEAQRAFDEVYGTDTPELGDMAQGSKSPKEDVNYRYASDPQRSCGKCKFFTEPRAVRS